ncbi:MAG: glutamate-1-semialdehyde 2,1-aminomutase [Acidobacteria bacterium]|nr:glutamate-1-semialdehyde 2,1-aminomutase [Acidobacteriota bacterium]
MGNKSEELLERAKKVIPGGVNAPVRGFGDVGGSPHFVETGQGSRVFDADKLQLIDCVGSWGSMILGHAHRYVVEAVRKAAMKGFAFGAPTAGEVELAEMIVEAMPGIEKVRLVSSGTEAMMSAIRVARAATDRDMILKFEGAYHGQIDALLSQPGSEDRFTSTGIPQAESSLTLAVPFNDLEAVRRAFNEHGGSIAAILVEPVATSMGCIPPAEGFLQGLRSICDERGAVLIFDEITTGFRVAYGGAQELYGIRADLTTLGKIIGGGLPIGAFGGRRDLIDMVRPEGDVYQSGRHAGNPLIVAGGLSTLSILRNGPTYNDLEVRSGEFEEGVSRAADRFGIPIQFNRVGSIWTIFFARDEVTDLRSARKANLEMFNRFFHLMLGEGVYLPPSQFESGFFSSAHARKDIQQIVERIQLVLKRISKEFEDDLVVYERP